MLNRKIDQELLDAIIAKVQENFVNGNSDYVTGMNSPISHMIRRRSLSDFPSNINQDYPHYNADLVDNGSHHRLVAAVGPRLQELPVFFQEVVANPRHPIKKIIALGKVLGYEDEKALDFHDYCLMSNATRHVLGDEFCDVSVDFDPKRNDGTFVICDTTAGESGAPRHTSLAEGILHSELTLTRGIKNALGTETVLGLETIQVTIIAHAADTNYLRFDEEQLPTLLRLYRESLTHNTLIHCPNGMGRTGQLILTFEILRQFDEIFATHFTRNNEQQALHSAEAILKILTMLRRDRKGLVQSTVQLQHAIKSAYALHHYQATLKLDNSKSAASNDKELAEPKKVRSHSAPTFFERLTFCSDMMKQGEKDVVAATTLRPTLRM